MFTIYGLSGPIFQGTLEELGRMPPVMARDPVTPVRRIGDQVEAGIAPEASVAATGGLSRSAVEAYQAMMPQNLERGPLYHAQQIMQRKLIIVNSRDNVTHAWRTLVDHQIHQAPVIDDSYRLVGIVSERNLLTKLNVADGRVRDVLARSVSDVMATPVVAATVLTDIRRIARVMLERDVDGVPIVNDNGELIGFVSRGDILRAVVTDPPLSVWR
ncbi:CBS domain containing membrane protein [Candidatus Propionivibrio aalborgensis]|uniref:CBS domain containing membrane protein n=1 Tax=Candidatus Propionivibrio aalborgensis TaxID=1860101 RepID=A0A1A8XWG2_9RHOO|nr:CBS domain-containing protein [Candidatus Propionivibrio aalborgensis]SBT09051.1 CBS domain containing membrane protein [Candidatus Propionivibrio aalborgensis]